MKYLLIILTIISVKASAQSIGGSTINSAGGGTIIAGNTHDFAIAEMTLVSTDVGTNAIVTHGVLQPQKLLAEAVNDITKLNTVLTIYPNPTNGVVQMQLLDLNFKIENIEILDVLGKVVYKLNKPMLSNAVLKLDMTHYATGSYFLQINKQFTYKIIKINN